MTSPESAHLRRVLASLAARLDEQTDGLSAAEELTELRDALARLTDPATADEVLEALDAELSSAEATWLADEVLRRWAAIGRPVVDAMVRVVPAASAQDADAGSAATGDPLGRAAARTPVSLRVEVDGLDPGWTVAWTGATAQPDGSDDPGGADADAPRAAQDGGALWTGETAEVTARVMGRGVEGRVVLTASWRPDGAPPAVIP